VHVKFKRLVVNSRPCEVVSWSKNLGRNILLKQI
jgi:hypothetical protein